MRFSEKRFQDLFINPRENFNIPMYQRAYEWNTNEKKQKNQVKEFWEDLVEIIETNSDFPLGTFIILKKIGFKNEIIDGQQRLTTILILLSSLRDIFQIYKKNEDLSKYLQKQYFKNENVVKFSPQEFDKNFWEDFIINNIVRDPKTPSQQKIKDAKKFFDKKLKEYQQNEDFLIKILEKIGNSTLILLELEEHKEATFTFELQNDRGKSLTNLDKLKAFFMYQVYALNGSNEDIEYIYREFEEIYKILNDFSLKNISEDEILNYHIYGYSDLNQGYNYREISELKTFFKKIDAKKRIEGIKKFSKDLKESYDAIKNFLNDKSETTCYLKDLSKFKFNFIYPFILKTYKYLDDSKRNKFLKFLANIVFIHNLAFTTAYIQSRLNEFLIKFNQTTNIDNLIKEIAKKLTNENYWQWQHIEKNLKSYMYNDYARYFFKRYEIYLRKNSTDNYSEELICDFNIYSGDKEKRTGWWIEHIAPQTKNEEENCGYDDYDEDFVENYLHSIGNLALVKDSHNIALSNDCFDKKLYSFERSPMKHHQEIKNFSHNKHWTRNSISMRTKKLLDFAQNTWALENYI